MAASGTPCYTDPNPDIIFCKMKIPTRFSDFHFRDVRGAVFQRNIISSNWVGFHENTEFKARASIYHVRRFRSAYDEYMKVQGHPNDQLVVGSRHPLKEIVFFELLGTTASLLGCTDSLLQEVNCALKLGLSATRPLNPKDTPEVTPKSIAAKLKELSPSHKIEAHLAALSDEKQSTTAWYRFLRRMRNTALHADLYSDSTEVRDIQKFLRTVAVDDDGAIISDSDLRKVLKRDITFKLDGEQYFMDGLIQKIATNTIDFVDESHRILIDG